MASDVDVRDRIDDYTDTIFAMVGFANFYRFDDETRQMKDEVIVFQGRRLTPSPERATTDRGDKRGDVTPDLGIWYRSNRGVLGDAKQSFPENRDFWVGDFEQLMAYDDDLTGWPCDGERVDQHDVVLLVHQSRAVAVGDYYEQHQATGRISFARPFSIISYNRSNQRAPYFFFEKRVGTLSEGALDGRLHEGVSVPMAGLRDAYSTVKLWDSKPPVPYIAQLIWEHVVFRRASEDARFAKLRKDQKLEVPLAVDEIVEELNRGFSFRTLCPNPSEHGTPREPHVPRRKWCLEACNALVDGGCAKWASDSREDVVVYFRKVEDVLEYMLAVCGGTADRESRQLPLFPDHPDQ